MTDKQIMIDGCNVSGCGFYHSETGTECHIALAFAEEYTDDNHTYFKCEQNPNCYYKQLKRKEQECERLKEAIKTKTGKDYINEIQDITMKYECHQKSMGVCWWGKYGKETKCIGIRECHKRELEVIQKLETTLGQLKTENEAWQKDLATMDAVKETVIAQCKALKQTLTEIKEIAETAAKCMYATYSDDYTEGYRWLGSIILQKISECEGNDETTK